MNWHKVVLLFLFFSFSFPQETGSIKVAIWGEVKKPGVYYLSGVPDILELISQAGGPTVDANLSSVTLIEGLSGKKKKVSLKGPMTFLASGDIVVVPAKMSSRIKDILPLVTTLTVTINLALTVWGK